MLNCTSRKQVDLVRDAFFKKYQSPEVAMQSNPTEMAELISILGFKNRRTNTIQRFSNDWLSLNWSEPKELYGIGKYAQDSWDIFYKGDLSIEPKDGVLGKYLAWARTQPENPVK